jgi:hypothetical protein
VFLYQSALCHDADHRGISNVQLGKENEEMAIRYENKSLAEQNSLDICWNLLMKDSYKDLRHTLFDNKESEFKRFRQVLVNGKMPSLMWVRARAISSLFLVVTV